MAARAWSAAGAQCVPGPHPALVAAEDPGVDQDLQVVGDGRLGQAERLGQLAHARLAALVRGDHRDQPQPGRIGQRLEDAGQVGSLCLGERLVQQRGAAVIGERPGNPAGGDGGCGHPPSMPKTLTGVYFPGHSRHRQSSM
jgi:hypothetical protein